MNYSMAVNGKLSLSGGSVFESRIVALAYGGYGQLAVKGPVSLGGATLAVRNTGPALSPGDTLTIVSNQGPGAVSGTFANLPEGSTITDVTFTNYYRITYKGGASGRDVVLTVLAPAIGPEADLSVTQTATPDPVAKGDRARFTMSVFNHGPVATGATLRGRVPAGTTLVSLDNVAGWSCRTGTGEKDKGIACTRDSAMDPGSLATLTLVVRVDSDAGPTVVNRATVSGDTPDPSLVNNSSEATISVTGAASG